MSLDDPQFYYIFLILPFLFGVALIGEGIYKISKQEWNGLINIVLGVVCMGFVIVVYYMFSRLLPENLTGNLLAK